MATIRYDVPGVRQGSSNTCWLACFRMLALYRRQVGRPLNLRAQALLEDDVIARFEELNRPMNPRLFSAIAGEFGLSALNIAGLTRPLTGTELVDPLAAHEVLRTRGPFTLGGTVPGVGGHAIVICGASDTGDFDIQFIDPRWGDRRHLPLARLQTGFPPDGGPLFVF